MAKRRPHRPFPVPILTHLRDTAMIVVPPWGIGDYHVFRFLWTQYPGKPFVFLVPRGVLPQVAAEVIDRTAAWCWTTLEAGQWTPSHADDSEYTPAPPKRGT